MAIKKDLFKTAPFMKDLDIDQMFLQIANKEDIATIVDLNAYIRIANKPRTASLKSIDGPDLQSGDMGDPVMLNTDSGWMYSYHLAKGKTPAFLELSASSFQSVRAMAPEVEEMTHQAKTFRSAVEVVDFLVMQGWEKFTIEGGSPLLSWACWAYLTHIKKKVSGYKPDDYDKVRLELSKELFDGVKRSIGQLEHQAAPAAATAFASGATASGATASGATASGATASGATASGAAASTVRKAPEGKQKNLAKSKDSEGGTE